jgi:hypothetical protein
LLIAFNAVAEQKKLVYWNDTVMRVLLQTQLNAQLTILVTEQQALLKEQRDILQALLRNQLDNL